MANILFELQDRKFRKVIIHIRNKKCSFRLVFKLVVIRAYICMHKCAIYHIKKFGPTRAYVNRTYAVTFDIIMRTHSTKTKHAEINNIIKC